MVAYDLLCCSHWAMWLADATGVCAYPYCRGANVRYDADCLCAGTSVHNFHTCAVDGTNVGTLGRKTKGKERKRGRAKKGMCPAPGKREYWGWIRLPTGISVLGCNLSRCLLEGKSSVCAWACDLPIAAPRRWMRPNNSTTTKWYRPPPLNGFLLRTACLMVDRGN